MKVLFAAALIALAVPALAQETKYGAGVTMKESTPIASLVAKPHEFVGKTIRIDGVVTEVCTEMGCWMAVGAEGGKSGSTVRLKVEDGVIVFPVSAKGKRVSAEGVFEKVSAASGEAKEAATEHAKKDPKASPDYQIKTTGAVVR